MEYLAKNLCLAEKLASSQAVSSSSSLGIQRQKLWRFFVSSKGCSPWGGGSSRHAVVCVTAQKPLQLSGTLRPHLIGAFRLLAGSYKRIFRPLWAHKICLWTGGAPVEPPVFLCVDVVPRILAT